MHGNRPFIVGRSRRLESLTNVWRRRIAQAFAAAGEFEQTPTPHRFRHTFARILLEKGVSVADVAELMGDDEETVRISYSAWVPERQNRLTAILRDAFSERPKLVGIRGGLAVTATQRAGCPAQRDATTYADCAEPQVIAAVGLIGSVDLFR